MRYEVRYDPKAEKQLEKLPHPIAQRIIKKLREVAETGRGLEALKEEAYGFKARIGDYRAPVDLTFHPHTVWVRVIDHRSRIYKRL